MRGSPRVYAVGASPSPYAPSRAARTRPARHPRRLRVLVRIAAVQQQLARYEENHHRRLEPLAHAAKMSPRVSQLGTRIALTACSHSTPPNLPHPKHLSRYLLRYLLRVWWPRGPVHCARLALRGEFSRNLLGRDEGFEAPIVILLIADSCNHWRGGLSGRIVCESGHQANR
jgi:hypothetical protein